MLLSWTAGAVTDTFTASGTWTAPAGVTSVDVEVWGGGGAGGGQNMNSDGGGGGGGGAYSKTVAVPVVPGNTYTVTVGAGGLGVAAGIGGTGGDSHFINAATVMAKGGAGGAPSTGTPPAGGLGGAAAAGVGTTKFSGGNGGAGRNNATGRGGPGGSSAGTAANGTSGAATWVTATAAAAPVGGGIGGNGGNVNGQNGFAPASGNGGGGGGAAEGTNRVGGNGAGGKVLLTYTLPSVTSISLASASPTNAASVSWTVIFSTSVTGVSSSNFALVNAGLGGTPAITGVSGSGTTWTVTASTGTGSGTLGLNMANSTGLSATLTNLPFTGQVYTIDRTSPTVSSIVRVNPTPTALASVAWTVTFNQSVTGVDAGDFALAQSDGMSGALITAVTPVSGTVYTVTASTGSGYGTLGLNLVDDNSIADAATNPLGGAAIGDGDFSGEAYEVYITSATASPSSCANVAGIGTLTWAGLTGPLANDNVTYATVLVNDNQVTNYLQCTGYGFSIPSTATINGITVNVDRKATGTTITDAAMRVVKAGVIGATDRSTATTYTTTDVTEAHGGAADLWGSTWTPTDINALNFGAALASTKVGTAGLARTVSVDHMSIRIDYSLPVNCTSKVSGNWNAATTWKLCRGGIPLAGDTVTIAAGHTVTQNVNTPAIGTLTVNGTLNNAANTLSVAGDILINTGGTYTGGSGAASITGNFSNSGSFTSGSGTWTFNGTAVQSITGTTTFQNLALNNASGLTLNSAVTTSGVLTLTSGAIATGSNILTTTASCPASVSRTGGFVDGNLRLTFPSGTTTCTFPVGSNGNYSPIAINLVTTLLGGGTLTGSTTGNEHPAIANSGIDSALDVNRYWSLWANGDTVDVGSYGVTFGFVSGELDALATPGNFVIGKYAAGTWTRPTPVTAAANSTGVSSVSGPIAAATGFVAGEPVFDCFVPAGSPAGVTCVCDNFNRTNLNPSTIYAGNWVVNSSSGTFGLPRIVANRLRLTDNTTAVATVAAAPGTFPASSNWISVEFKHYAYGGTGADGMAFILSDAAIPVVPGAFGGSMGYAQKSNPGSDCTIVGGCPGFAGGWIGVAIDEYGNFSANTEGRTGGAAPGQTLDSISVRGSGAGMVGYPYLGGTATLTPPIDAPSPATAGLGHAYRLTVDARNYTWNGTTGAKTALVAVDRDTTGSGTNYSPLIPGFDAYAVNPAQADVPADWQLSFTGSSGALTNIHEISGLKICAQSYVPPAGFRIVVDNLTPTTCPTDPQPTLAISALNTNGQVVTTYTNTVVITATLQGGALSSATLTPVPGYSGTWDSVNKRYTFAAADHGTVNFTLSDTVQEDVFINVSEYLGAISSTSGTPVQFSSGIATFVVDTADSLGAGVVAGRPHLMSVKRNASVCGGGTDTTFAGIKPLDAWYSPSALGSEHPSGAAAPQICQPVAGACLTSYGACQTPSIAAPVASASSNNLNLTFTAGVASFCLVTSDVGKYSLSLRDDATVPAVPVTGTSAIMTVRPFAVVVSDVMQGALDNPAVDTAGGAIFAKAGTAFQADVGGYLWNSSGDANGDGLPDSAATYAQLTGAGIAPYYADTVTLIAAAPFTPAAGVLNNGAVTLPGGGSAAAETADTLNYSEVGSFTLTAAPATNYLNSTGVDLTPRAAIFAGPANVRTALVGRFIPDHFDTSVVSAAGVPMPCLGGVDPATATAWVCPPSNDAVDGFVYSGQPFSVQVTAKNQGGSPTTNYQGNFAKAVTLSAVGPDGGAAIPTATPGGTLSGSAVAATAFSGGSSTATVPTPEFSFATAPGAPTDIFVRALDAEGVTSLRAVAADSVEGGVKVVSGRIKLSNAHGSELLKLPLTATVLYYNGNFWVSSATDTVTSLLASDFALGFPVATANKLAACETALSVMGTSPTFALSLSKPGSGNNGWTNLTLNLDGLETGNRCTVVGGAGAAVTSANRPWLQFPEGSNPTARATFGVYKGNNEFIYLRENY